MENYENNEFRPEPEQTEPQPQMPPVGQPNSGQGVGRKESPFADSPYVTNRQPEPNPYRNTYVPPVPPQYPPEKPKKVRSANSGKIWKTVLSAVLILALVAGSCGITAALVNNRWETEVDYLLRDMKDMNEQLGDMQKQINSMAATMGGNSVSGTLSSGEGLTPGQVYAKNVQSVVLISCEVQSMYHGNDYDTEDFSCTCRTRKSRSRTVN